MHNQSNQEGLVTRRTLLQQAGATEVLGRASELERLVQTLITPSACGFINVYGISGIGKSRLLGEYLDNGNRSFNCFCFRRSARAMLSSWIH